MESKSLIKGHGKLFSILSICIPLVIFLLILNWFFKMTPYQKFQGMPLLMAPYASIIGFILGYVSIKKSPNNIAKLGIVINVILFVSPYLYWIVGTLIFGL